MTKDLTTELRKKIQQELITIYENHDTMVEAEFHSFLHWMLNEYKNFMVISREDFIVTLNEIKAKYDNYYSDLVNVLLNNIDSYGATKCFYYGASELLEYQN